VAIEDILRALEEQGQADCEACTEEARAHAAQILEDAQAKATSIHEHHISSIERTARTEAMKRVNAARLKGRMQVSGVRGEGLDGVFDTARQRLGTLRQRADYPQLFASLAQEALDGVEGPVVIRVAPGDVDLARQVASQLGVSAEVKGDVETAGGLIVESSGGKIVRRNTLEDRLGRARPYIQADVARVLLA
jgi:V/A-type H+/Na+-transporting ATPase subunit E